MKLKRHEKIIELVNKYEIETQEELASLLNQAGFRVTQATISRDIRELRLSKVNSHDGKQKYAIMSVKERGLNDKLSKVLKEGYISSMEASDPGGCKNSYRYGHGCSNGTGCYGASGLCGMYCR